MIRSGLLPRAAGTVLAAALLWLPALPAPAALARPAAPAVASAAAPAAGSTTAPAPIPLLAFYYQWFDVTSWSRAKMDYPIVGKYSSDSSTVMRQHIRWAKSAGINGFIVSWKDSPTNDRRLSLLMEVARSESFKLAMIYQGLDFNRKPLPVQRVAADFQYFRRTYAADPVFFRLGGKPLTIWSGTWAFSHADVAAVTGPVRPSMLVLNSEKTVDGYSRLADVTDGDAYYWSSVNPATNTNYTPKLIAMSQVVHRNQQYWIAPLAPGFDARMVGGSRTVERNGGATLRTEYATAMASSPDVLGLISWNEFSENSYVEPSKRYGMQSLEVLSDLRRAAAPVPTAAADSSEPATPRHSSSGFSIHVPTPLAVLGGLLAVMLAGVAAARPAVRRRDAERGVEPPDPDRPALPTGRRPVPALPRNRPAHLAGEPERPALPPDDE